MADDSSLAPVEAQTTGGGSPSTISLNAAVKNRFQVKDCSIKLEIVDTEAMMMTSGSSSRATPSELAEPLKKVEEEVNSDKCLQMTGEGVDSTTVVAGDVVKLETSVVDNSISLAPAASDKNESGSLAAGRSARKRPRKADPMEGRARDLAVKSCDSSSSKPSDTPVAKPPVRPRRPTPKLSSRQKKAKRRYDVYLDEMTSRSGTNENLFSEINWEENLDIDTSALVDEFAPRPPTKSVKPKTTESPIPIIPIPSSVVEVVEADSDSPMTAQEFRSGTKISVLDYKTSTWNHGTVTEVDWEENEVLIIYDDRSKEWVSMSSQRLSRCNVNEKEPKDEPGEPSSNDYVTPFGNATLASKSGDNSRGFSTSASTSGLAARKRARARSSGGGSSSRSRRDRKRKRPPQHHQPQQASSSLAGGLVAASQDGPMSDGKFELGEKVLAKWSDFRMQKFPAVIKRISGKDQYDLLFYDGFEKTIRAENVFKTTEEEVARYKQTNPSEADAFVDIDADSKEARRQRKKKSFGDGFLSASEYPRKRTSFVAGSPSTPQPATQIRSDSTAISSGGGGGGGSSGKQSERFDAIPTSAKRSRPSRRSEEAAPFVENAESVVATHEALKVEEAPKIRPVLDRGRFLADIPEGATPLKMALPDSDVFQVSVIMPDTRLPPGWVKHCVKREGTWKAFLLSPDRFKITNRAELADYAQKMLKIKSPKKISFQFLEEILPDLIEKQKDLEPSEDFQNWVRRKSVKKIKPKHPPVTPPVVVPTTTIGGDANEAALGESDPAVVSSKQQDDSDTSGLLKCVKEGCDKRFRKESLLHMHLKHYHEEEFRKIVMMTPRVDELATARTERSGYKADSPVKPSPPPVKKPAPKLSPQVSDSAKTDYLPMTPSSHPAPDEKKTTIKTLLPRQSTSQEPSHQPSAETMEMGTVEDDFTGHASKNRVKKPRLEPQVGSALAELGYPPLQPPVSGVKSVKKKIPSMEKTESAVVDEGKASPSYEVTDDGVLIERLRSEELINCICGFREEDGLMIQCDICMCWQHGICSGMLNDSDVPERYVCYICRNPPKVRSSQKYSYANHYLTQGKLASFTFRKKDSNDIAQREGIIKKCYDILGSLHNMENVECSLRAKLNIAQRSDHPKLYLWAKNWENKKTSDHLTDDQTVGSRVPVPEAPIDLDECRSRLLDHIDSYIEQLDTRLNTIHSQLLVLDSQDDSSDPADSDKLTKQVLYTINKDLITVKKLAKLE